MAPDGSGGVVYRKIVDGVPHVYVDQYVHGAWRAPVQADVGQAGPATTPAIAAANGGELLVVWVQPWEVIESSLGATPTLHYRLMSALLQSGASRFSEVEPVDDVGGGTGVDPALTMSPSGSAYVSYRVVTNPLTSGVSQPVDTPLPMDPGDELVDVRVARFDGAWWSPLGAVNAYEGIVTDRAPTASNAPQIATVGSNEAVVVWQEPDLTGYARIWSRYIYGSTLGDPIQLSPSSTASDRPVDVDADTPSVGFLGQAAFRLENGPGSPYGAAEAFGVVVPTRTASGSSTVNANELGGASTVGPPDAGADILGDHPVGVAVGGQATLITISGGTPASTVLGPVSSGGSVLVAPDPAGGWAAAWPGTDAGGLPVIDVSELMPGGAMQTGSLSAPLSGTVTGLSFGSSMLGEGLIAWMQGPTDQQQVMAAVVQPPPEAFQFQSGTNTLSQLVSGPSGWVRPAQAKIRWAPAVDPLDQVTYQIAVDGQSRRQDLRGPAPTAPALTLGASGASPWELAEARSFAIKLRAAGLGTGAHTVHVYATDQTGQQTSLGQVKVRIDASPPTVGFAPTDHDRGIRVRVNDQGSGVAVSRTRISFGDRTKTVARKDKVTHVYRRAGRYVVTVAAIDQVGNVRHTRIVVKVK